ncbi:hypothetical protein F183_A21130 [Bryobacterales bacterium F-183]|nr:hypothetical protein F183_A21130 [Bryobacterales bacterium F-183]
MSRARLLLTICVLTSAYVGITLTGQSLPDLTVTFISTANVNTDPQSLQATGVLAATVRNLASVPVAPGFRVFAYEDRNGNRTYDAASDLVLGSALVEPGFAANGEKLVQIPLSGQVRFRGNLIYVTADIDNAIAEVSESNNTWDTGRSTPLRLPSPLDPRPKWNKSTFAVAPGSRQVMMTPLVVDLDKDGTPEIVFTTFGDSGVFWLGATGDGRLRAISGRDGRELWTNTSITIEAFAGLAVGDIDNDGFPEIIGHTQDRRPVAFEHNGTVKWQAVAPHAGNGQFSAGSASIADLDGDGTPEIIFGSTVYRNDGSLRWQGSEGKADNGGGGPLSVIADIDLDGKQEVVAGKTVYNRDGSVRWSSSLPDGFAAVGNFDADPFGEIAVVANGSVRLHEHDGAVKWGPVAIPGVGSGGVGYGGAPTIADFDGDGQPEIGVASASKYVVFETAGSIKWQTDIEDFSSAQTGSSVFDFDGDGTAEVVYGDERNLRIYKGSDGQILYTFPRGSGTALEYAVIADIDRDGHADIVVPANSYYRGGEDGIYVISGPNWVRTRSIWNQHAYSITNVNEDGTIPRQPLPNWRQPGLNNFRLNTFEDPNLATAAPDLTTSLISKNDAAFPSSVRLTSRVGNGGGLQPQTQRIKVAFYRGDPASGGQLIATTETSRTLSPGEYEDVSVTWANPPQGLHPIVVVADDNGQGIGQVEERDKSNNKAGSNVLLGVGPFPLVDSLITRFKDKSADVVWTAVSGASSYNIYRRTGMGAPVLAKRNHVGLSFTDVGLTNYTPYFYSVRWINALGIESATGTEASVTPAPLPSGGDTPPTIQSYPPTRARVGASYTYQPRAGDPDPGDALTYSLISPPTGMTIGTTGAIAWTPSIAAAGYNDITLRVQDTRGRAAIQTFRLFVEVLIVDGPPTISSTPISLAQSGELYAYQVVARDPENGLVTYALSVAPSGMTINPANGLVQWIPTRAQVGSQSATVRVSDAGGNAATQSFTIQVSRGNKAPTITSIPVTEGRVGVPYSYVVTATDPEADPITFSLAAAPAGMVINPTSGVVRWTPTAPQQGSVRYEVRVTDNGGLGAAQAVTVAVRPANLPPSISSSPVLTAQANQPYRYQLVVVDGNFPDEAIRYSLAAGPAGMTINASTGLVQWIPAESLVNTSQNVTVRATDSGDLSADQSFTVRVTAASQQLPTVSLTSPTNGSTVTSDVPIIGTVTDPSLRLWRVEYQPTGDTQWYTISRGTAPVTNGSLGTLPATLLANNAYRIRLYAENAVGSITTPDIGANIDTKQLKMGDFTLAFEDLRVPGFTFPISIMRKYDSKRPQVGDFGPGWTLGFSEVDVRLDPNFNVFLTLPDARRVKFSFTPACASPVLGACFLNIVNMAWTGDAGVYDKLESIDCPTGVQSTPPSCSLFGAPPPSQWKLTTKEGLKYWITGGRITRMEDRVGNWMQIDLNGVTSNTGRNIAIERNVQGLVTKIKEPTPGGEMRYEYDAQGRLIRWINLNGKTTTYFYDNASYPHYLTKIIDPLGRQALRNVFNLEGRLVAQCNADGNITTLEGCSQFNPQPETRTFTAINGRGFKTELVTDDRGNVITARRYLDASSYLDTVNTYDANNNMLSERDPEGNVRSYTYDSRSNRLTETDPGGRTTTYTYVTGCEKVETLRDPAGNVTRSTYDNKCNLRFVQDPLLKSTEYRYNAYGQRTEMIDSNGTTWTWKYLLNGLLQSVVDPFGKAITFSFSTQGTLLSRSDRNGRRIDFEYDAAHHLTRETWDNGRVLHFVYDELGALLAATDSLNSITMTYDSLGRVKSVDTVGGQGMPRVVMTYLYDANGNITQVSDSLGGNTVYTYDALDRLTAAIQSGAGVQPKRIDLTYSSAGLVTQLRRFSDLAGTSGVVHTGYEYDCGGCAGRLTAIRHRKPTDSSTIQDTSFTRDASGNILASRDDGAQHSYSYDPLRRLTAATHPASDQPNEFYTYDSVGNRMTSHISSSYSYSQNTMGVGNRLVQDNQSTYQYDGEGNAVRVTNRQTLSYALFTYDHHNRLTSTRYLNAANIVEGEVTYRYDCLGRRISASRGAEGMYYAYDGLNPILVFSLTGTVVSRRMYTRGLDDIVGDERSSVTRWYLKDQVGSTRKIVDNAGTALEHYKSDSFGRLLSPKTAQSSDLLFTGRDHDSEGRTNFRLRQYDSATGRFLQEDTLEPFGYVYGTNNPLSFRDPLGASPLEEIALTTNNVRLFTSIAAQHVIIGAAVNDYLNCIAAAAGDRNKKDGCVRKLIGVVSIGSPAAALGGATTHPLLTIIGVAVLLNNYF